MAAGSSAESLEEGLSCSLCHKYFTEPVNIECGHSFCWGCIAQRWERWETDFSCPQCGGMCLKRKFTPSVELDKVVEIAKRMKAEMMAERGEVEKVCELHQEPLKLFCRDDQKLLCATCVESKDHHGPTHVFVAVEEAVQDYKEELETQLQAWRENRETAISVHTQEKNKCQDFLKKVEAEKQKFMSKFEEVQQFLKQQEKSLLDQLEAFVREEEKFITKLSSEICVTDIVIHELEEKSRYPENAFLKDVEKNFSRCEAWSSQHPDVCSELEEKLYAFSKKYIILKDTLHKFTGSFPEQLKVEGVNVTLDPDTAHCRLKVSDDQKSVMWTDYFFAVTDYPQRFSSAFCVLGCETFTSGRHYWEVNVGAEGDWAVGVAKETVKRKEKWISRTPEEGIWAVQKTDFRKGNLELDVPKRVGVYLNYEGDSMVFFDAEEEAAIVSYQASFKAEKIRPFFWLLGKRNSVPSIWLSS